MVAGSATGLEKGAGIKMERDFASFLEELLTESEENEARARIAAPPSVPFTFLEDTATDGGPARGGPTDAYLALREELLAEIAAPDTDPAAIARELGLDGIRNLKALDRLRRSFAFQNHPDRVRPQWRERAMVRMQIANRMIDDVKRRLGQE
jgi:hypothetical protein